MKNEQLQAYDNDSWMVGHRSHRKESDADHGGM